LALKLISALWISAGNSATYTLINQADEWKCKQLLQLRESDPKDLSEILRPRMQRIHSCGGALQTRALSLP